MVHQMKPLINYKWPILLQFRIEQILLIIKAHGFMFMYSKDAQD